MKNSKRIISAVIAVLLAFAVAVPGFSANVATMDATGDVKITMTADDKHQGTLADTKFFGYMLMSASVAEKDGNIANAAYTVNPKYQEILKGVTKQENDAAIIDYISGLKDKPTEIKNFADAVYMKIKGASLAPDINADGNVFPNAAEGYWLIVGKKNDETEAEDTLVMLDTKGKSQLEVTIKPIDEPIIEKQVYDEDDMGTGEGGWRTDAADYQIGELVPFKLTARPHDPDISDHSYDDFTSYYLKFTDTLSDGLVYYDPVTEPETNDEQYALKVYAVNGDARTELKEIKSTEEDESIQKTGYIVSYDAASHILTVELKDLKSLVNSEGHNIGITPEYSIVVEYYAKLTPAAEKIKPETNDVFIEYSNDPYDEKSKGESPHVEVQVYTYGLVVDKKANDGKDAKKYLAGAEFNLYKLEGSVEDFKAHPEKYLVEDYLVKGPVRFEYYPIAEASGSLSLDTTNKAETNEDKTAARFVFEGLDEGTYVLSEVTVPDGYNGIEDIIFTVGPDEDELAHTAQSVKSDTEGFAPYNKDDGQFNKYYLYTTIENKTGLELPSTGGTGRTVLVLFGFLCALIAGVILVTNKKMKGVN